MYFTEHCVQAASTNAPRLCRPQHYNPFIGG